MLSGQHELYLTQKLKKSAFSKQRLGWLWPNLAWLEEGPARQLLNDIARKAKNGTPKGRWST